MSFLLAFVAFVAIAVLFFVIGMVFCAWFIQHQTSDAFYINWVKPRLDNVQRKIDRGEGLSR